MLWEQPGKIGKRGTLHIDFTWLPYYPILRLERAIEQD
jgi:hypothetical protein